MELTVVLANVITGETEVLDVELNDAIIRESSVYDILGYIKDELDPEMAYSFVLNDEELDGDDVHVFVEDGDILTIIESPAGGAMLASLLAAIKQMVVSMIISWVANALFAPKEFKQGKAPNAAYTLNNQQNSTDIGAYAGVGYGTVRLYPKLINQPYIAYDKCDQKMFRCMAVGQGTYTLDKLMVASEEVDHDKDYWAELVKVDNAAVPPLMKDPLYTHDVVNLLDTFSNEKIGFPDKDFTPNVHELSKDAIGISVNVTYPRGLFYQDSKGGRHDRVDTVVIELLDTAKKVVNKYEHTNHSAKTVNPAKQHNDAARYTFKHLKPANTDWSYMRVSKKIQDSNSVKDSLQAQVEHAFELYPNAPRDWKGLQVMVLKLTASEDIKGDGKINGYFTRTDVGNKLKDVITDIYTNTVYGAGLEAKDLVFDAPSAHTEVDCYYEDPLTVLDSIEQLCRPHMFLVLPHNEKLKIQKDVVQTLPIQKYDNTRMYDVEASYLFDKYRDQFDCIEVEYKDKDWKTVSTKYPTTGINPKVIPTFGLASKSQAETYCKYVWKQEKARRLQVSFKTDIQGRIPNTLDLLEVTHSTVDSTLTPRLFQVIEVTSTENECQFSLINYDPDIYK